MSEDTQTTQEPETFDIGEAVRRMKAGKKVARKGWNGKSMYLWLLPATDVPLEWCKEEHLKKLASEKGHLPCLASVRMRTADGSVLTGWLASQSDLLAEDWVEVVL